MEPEGSNRAPLLNRNDEAIDQIIRNIVSHRFDSKNNIINKGYVDYDKGTWTLSDKGKDYLHENMKGLFKNELKD